MHTYTHAKIYQQMIWYTSIGGQGLTSRTRKMSLWQHYGIFCRNLPYEGGKCNIRRAPVIIKWQTLPTQCFHTCSFFSIPDFVFPKKIRIRCMSVVCWTSESRQRCAQWIHTIFFIYICMYIHVYIYARTHARTSAHAYKNTCEAKCDFSYILDGGTWCLCGMAGRHDKWWYHFWRQEGEMHRVGRKNCENHTIHLICFIWSLVVVTWNRATTSCATPWLSGPASSWAGHMPWMGIPRTWASVLPRK